MNNLNQIMQAASAQMYQQAGAQAGPQPGADSQQSNAGSSNADDNVQDADFEEVK